MRKARNTVAGLPHHVILRGNNRRRLFSYSTDYRRFLWDVGRALERRRCELHALTLMTNHVHMVVTAHVAADLSTFVKAFAQRYAQYRNKRREASGKLFEERFVSVPITNDDQLAITTAYADLNALRAGMVDDPFEHCWSTFAIHAGRPERSKIPQHLWTPSSWYCGLGRTQEERAICYLDWVNGFSERDQKPAAAVASAEVDELGQQPYHKRLERPDRTRASDAYATWSASKSADGAKPPLVSLACGGEPVPTSGRGRGWCR
jgi:putative transposase